MTNENESFVEEARLEDEPDVRALEQESPLEPIESEIKDATFSPPDYEIVSIPADYTLEGLTMKMRRDQLKIPGFQRKFVWTQRQASRLIESFLLGLPVPALFLFADPQTGEQQVIDGQQRLKSVVQFFDGEFQNASMGKKKAFRLVGLAENSPYAGCTVRDLEERFASKFAKLNDAVMRAFVIKQLDPNDATSIYHIFERLNTGGSQLIGQEIRNCVYHGRLNELLNSLNSDPNWRKILGKRDQDARMRDVEMVLRFTALYFFSNDYKKPMKDFLSTAMSKKRNLPEAEAESLNTTFRDTCARIVETLGESPFRRTQGMNAAVFDAVFTVVAKHRGPLPSNFSDRYRALAGNQEFKTHSSARTTDVEPVRRRLELARTSLFDNP